MSNDKDTNKESSTMSALKEDKDVNTTTVSFKNLVTEKLMQMKDLATQEHKLPVEARLRERMKTIQELGRARNLKIRGQWKTIAPKFHMRNLTARKLDNSHAEIKFEVYEMDGKGNKVLHENKTKVIMANGDVVERTTSAEYKIAYEVIETIKDNKPITREVMEFNA